MSAFICDRAHIAAIVEAYREHCKTGASDAELSEIGADLWAENWASVTYRYPRVPAPAPQPVYGAHRKPKRHYWPVEVAKALRCLEWQSCEHPAWKKSEARRLLHEIAWELLCKLRGYDAAPWCIIGEG